MDDFYKLLGVERSATDDELKKAYRKIARDCHPDMHPGDNVAEERFKKVSLAYDILSDADKRAKYDAGANESRKPEAPRRSYQELRDEAIHNRKPTFFDFVKEKAEEFIVNKTPLKKGLEEKVTLDGIDYRIVEGRDVYMEDCLYIKFSENYEGAVISGIPVLTRQNGTYVLGEKTLTEKLESRIQPPLEVCFPGHGIAGGDYFVTVEVRYPEKKSPTLDKIVELLKKIGE